MMLKRFAGDQRGASVVEFALLIGPFLLLSVGLVEVSRAFWTRQALHEVAAATARCVGVAQVECSDQGSYDPSRTLEFALDLARGRAIALAAENVSIEREATCDGMDGAVIAVLDAHFPSVFPFEQIIDFSASACFLDWTAL